ncbi:MAG: VWA domain-containing protein, partial [Saprospiraceae bacterium]|nr:VWA domain-containing protein [Saprospiraceae bacterium]
MLNDLYFEYPQLLHLLWVAPLQMAMLWVYWRWRQNTLRKLGSAALEERLLLGFSKSRFWLKNVLFGLSLGLLALSVAGPVRVVKLPAEAQMSADIVIGLDVSKSMLATDLKPNRLDRAKSFILKLVAGLENERMGLLFFAG